MNRVVIAVCFAVSACAVAGAPARAACSNVTVTVIDAARKPVAGAGTRHERTPPAPPTSRVR